MSRDQAYITEVRRNVRQLWTALNNLVEAQREWNALDYSNTLENGVEENEGITKLEVGSCVFDTPNAFVAVLNQGHATNLAKLL